MSVGLLFALPALRTRGANLAVITMGLGLALFLMVFTNTEITGDSGIAVGQISIFGIDVDSVRHPERYTMLVLVALVLCMVLVSNVRRSHVGRALRKLGGHPELREGFKTDNGNVVIDCRGLSITDPPGLEAELNNIAGVVTNGLFARRPADVLLLGEAGGVRALFALKA